MLNRHAINRYIPIEMALAKPNMGLVYDALTAARLLTMREVIDESLFYDMRMMIVETSGFHNLEKRLQKNGIHPRSGPCEDRIRSHPTSATSGSSGTTCAP